MTVATAQIVTEDDIDNYLASEKKKKRAASFVNANSLFKSLPKA